MGSLAYTSDMAFSRKPSIRRFLHPYYGKVLKALRPHPSERILEVGCNSGTFGRQLGEQCKEVVGIDLNPHGIPTDNVQYYTMSAEDIQFEPESFDKIASMHTIEHVHNLGKSFTEMERVLKPGGRAVFVYPYELFRGMSCVISATVMFKNPFMARKMHLHRLTPKRLVNFYDHTSFKHVHSNFFWGPNPSFLTILEKE